jgi:YbbR domain-containing protein
MNNADVEQEALIRVAKRLHIKVTPEMTSVEIANRIAQHDKTKVTPSRELQEKWNEILKQEKC